jgi:hypothetical protein
MTIYYPLLLSIDEEKKREDMKLKTYNWKAAAIYTLSAIMSIMLINVIISL